MRRLRYFKSKNAYGLYVRNVHLFFYRWGVTLRVRRGDGWTHYAARVEQYAWTHAPDRSSRQLTLESWLTSPGCYDRVLGSKRYVRVKVAL